MNQISRKEDLLKVVIIGWVAVLVSGCGISPGTIATGAGGALVGAGAGAIVGSVIDNGDVLASAGLGAGIGLGVALAGDYIYTSYKEEDELATNNLEIIENHDKIIAGDEEIRRLRTEALDQSKGIEFDSDDTVRSPYFGATLGAP